MRLPLTLRRRKRDDEARELAEQMFESMRWLAYFQAWLAGWMAAEGDPTVDHVALAHRDYKQAKEWAGRPGSTVPKRTTP